MHIAAFAEAGVAREGVRENLLLNPLEFRSNQQVLDYLQRMLPTWQPLPAIASVGVNLDLAINYKKKRSTQERHDYELIVALMNRGTEQSDRFTVDLEFPFRLLEQPRRHVCFVSERSSPSIGFFRATHIGNPTLFPGDTQPVLSVEYYVDSDIFYNHSELLQRSARATLYVPGIPPRITEASLASLQNY